MATEIERKFLVTSDGWRAGAAGTRIVQGYLSRDPERTVRIRLAGDAAFLTVKGRTTGATRAEYEYAIPRDDADALLALCVPPLVEKTRYRVTVEGKEWEIDEFAGANAPLVVAELELFDEAERFERPVWLGREVTDDPRYYNSQLAATPYSTWAER